jgi:uncharacterized membrane protein YebE (DUF533 family)
MGGKALKYGGIAVIGSLAYKAYQNYQSQQKNSGTNPVKPIGEFDFELAKPLDPAAVAKNSENQAMAAEMYLASVMIVDEQIFMEKAYLGELAKQLKLLNVPPTFW